jgi:predicted SnoaL-like aldol condensation-catalyzing enzyme
VIVREDDLKDIARRWLEALNSGDLTLFDTLLDPNIVDHSGFSRIHGRGRDGIKRLVAELRKIMPDWSSSVDEITVDGDRVTIRHTGTGSPPPAFRVRASRPVADKPTPKVRLQLVSTIRIDQGRIVEHWARSAS